MKSLPYFVSETTTKCTHSHREKPTIFLHEFVKKADERFDDHLKTLKED